MKTQHLHGNGFKHFLTRVHWEGIRTQSVAAIVQISTAPSSLHFSTFQLAQVLYS